MANILIAYERKNRELENSVLLKIELERRGHQCTIAQYFEADKFNQRSVGGPDLLIVPHLYYPKSVSRNMLRFGLASHILNMQYEQVLSEKWENLGHHNPKGVATRATHICWGPATAERLQSVGVPKENAPIIGAVQLDLLRREYLDDTAELRARLSTLYGLDTKKRWVLFLSSFTYADIAPNRLAMNEAAAGIPLDSFVPIYSNSRNELLRWFERVLEKDKDTEFIYRPHPDELNLNPVNSLKEKYSNLKVISDGPAKTWIEASDTIFSWYSTTVVESHVLGKPYSILRPYPLSGDFDSVLLKHGVFIESYDDFEARYFQKTTEPKFAIDSKFIDLYYSIDPEKPSFIKTVDLIEDLLDKPAEFSFKFSLSERIGNISKIMIIKAIYFLWHRWQGDLNKYKSRINNNFIVRWLLEMDAQIATEEEIAELTKRLKLLIEKEIP